MPYPKSFNNGSLAENTLSLFKRYEGLSTTIPLRGSTLQANGSGKMWLLVIFNYQDEEIVYAHVKA